MKTNKQPDSARRSVKKEKRDGAEGYVRRPDYRAEQVRRDQYVDIFNGMETFAHFTANVIKAEIPSPR